jgi:hypothetical protein
VVGGRRHSGGLAAGRGVVLEDGDSEEEGARGARRPAVDGLRRKTRD